MIALIVPPLPAASRPSNTTITRRPLWTTHSCNRHNSVWSLRNSFSYSLRFILGLVSSRGCLDMGFSHPLLATRKQCLGSRGRSGIPLGHGHDEFHHILPRFLGRLQGAKGLQFSPAEGTS